MSKSPGRRRKLVRPASGAGNAGASNLEASPDYVSYHSGTTTPAGPAEAPAQPTAFAPAAFAFTAFVAAPTDKFYIKFRTGSLRPNHLITIRNNVDGWDKDVHGAYYHGEWVFGLEKERYPNGLTMKFVLNQSSWMNGNDMHLASSGEHVFTEGNISFPSISNRYRHGYDNLRTADSKIQQDAIPSNTSETRLYDAIIIGSGMGGGVLADALSDLGRNVLVLEAGSLLYPRHITDLPGDWSRMPSHHQVGNFLNEPGSDFLFGVQMNFGGRSLFWSGLIPRMHAWELDRWPAPVRNFLTSGGYENAEKLMRKQRTLGQFQKKVVNDLKTALPDYHVEDMPRSRHQPNLDSQGTIQNVLETSTGTFSSAALLLDSLSFHGDAGRDNLTINLNHLVTRIETQGDQATAVVCQDLVGNVERRYRAKQIVLAAGSLESPRIALRSQLGDPNHLIGVGLTDHPAYFSNTYELDPGSPYAGFENHAKVMMYHKQASSTDHPYNVEILINPKYWDAAHADDDVWKQQIGADQRTRVRLQFVFASPLDDNNRVLHKGEGNKLGIKVARNLSGSHLFDEVKGVRNAVLSKLGAPFGANDGMHFGNEGTPHHAGGSLRMSGNHSGVVDDNLKLENYSNLFVCDSSVFPIIPAANPSLTLAALALRLAAHLNQLP